MISLMWLPIVIGLFIYIMGIGVAISDRTTSYKNRYDIHSTGKYDPLKVTRNPEPKDMWMAIIWPLKFIWCAVWGTLDALNSLIQYPLLLLGVRYKGSKMDWKIRNFLEGKY